MSATRESMEASLGPMKVIHEPNERALGRLDRSGSGETGALSDANRGDVLGIDADYRRTDALIPQEIAHEADRFDREAAPAPCWKDDVRDIGLPGLDALDASLRIPLDVPNKFAAPRLPHAEIPERECFTSSLLHPLDECSHTLKSGRTSAEPADLPLVLTGEMEIGIASCEGTEEETIPLSFGRGSHGNHPATASLRGHVVGRIDPPDR